MNYTSTQLREMYRSLPSEVKAAIASPELSEKIQTLGKKYNLLLDKVGILSQEISYAMMGVTPSSQFIDNLSTNLGINRETAITLTREVSEQIFVPIREALKEVHKEDMTEKFITPNEEKSHILNEIENPLPTKPAFSTAQNVEAIIDARNELPAPEALLKPEITPPSNNPIDQKLAGATFNSIKKNKVDPYRESVEH